MVKKMHQLKTFIVLAIMSMLTNATQANAAYAINDKNSINNVNNANNRNNINKNVDYIINNINNASNANNGKNVRNVQDSKLGLSICDSPSKNIYTYWSLVHSLVRFFAKGDETVADGKNVKVIGTQTQLKNIARAKSAKKFEDLSSEAKESSKQIMESNFLLPINKYFKGRVGANVEISAIAILYRNMEHYKKYDIGVGERSCVVFLLREKKSQTMHLAFAFVGTKSAADALVDANFATQTIDPITFGNSNNKNVALTLHRGFASGIQETIANLQNAGAFAKITKVLKQYHDNDGYNLASVVTCGHSLGGAMALGFCYYLQRNWSTTYAQLLKYSNANDVRFYAYTYGAPKICNGKESADFIEKSLGKENIFRIYHEKDWVPGVPFGSYMHIGTDVEVTGAELGRNKGLMKWHNSYEYHLVNSLNNINNLSNQPVQRPTLIRNGSGSKTNPMAYSPSSNGSNLKKFF